MDIILIPPSNLTLPLANRDHMQGAITAPVSLLEYGDYECAFCGDAHAIITKLQQRLAGRLCFAFRNFPAANAHPHSQHAAEAAEAAGVQSKFWQMHDLLLQHQDALEDDKLAQYASVLGLDPARLLTELAAGVHTPRVREDFKCGARGGVNGTPAFFINGERYDGHLDFDELLEALLDRVR
jgi:protein-disulfide isomerase